MAEQTKFEVGAKASCSDGPCGEVRRMIIDPATGTVTHLVIEPKHRRVPGRLVPVNLVDATTSGIGLRCTLAEFGKLEPAEQKELAEGSGRGSAVPLVRPRVPRALVQMDAQSGNFIIPGGARIIFQELVPRGETQVRPGEPVHALDGEIGQVQGFLVDPGDHRVSHVLLREGHLWGRKQVAIPVSAVTGIKDGIRLNITRQQVANLPPVDIDRPGSPGH